MQNILLSKVKGHTDAHTCNSITLLHVSRLTHTSSEDAEGSAWPKQLRRLLSSVLSFNFHFCNGLVSMAHTR